MADNAVTRYLNASYEELKKVTWPTKQQTTNNTLIVIGMSIAMAAFFAILDYIFRAGIRLIV